MNSNESIQQSIKRSIEGSVPDVLPAILQQIQAQEEVSIMEQSTYPHKKRLFLPKVLLPVAAALLIFFGAWFGWMHWATDFVVAFDVNPSLALSVNRQERVMKIEARNEEAMTVLANMDLKGVKLDVAVNALIGSMVRNGYLSEIKNSILVTVEDRDSVKGRRLQERLSDEIAALLDDFSLHGSVLSQTMTRDREREQSAKEYGISEGKASLIRELIARDPRIQFSDVAHLSINDLNLLLSTRAEAIPGLDVKGQASSKGYIGQEKARSIAFSHAGVSESDIIKIDVEFDYEEGRMVYEVEFHAKGMEYDYDIDAIEGSILKFESKERNKPYEGGSNATDYIGVNRAESIALAHAGLQKSMITKLETELERDKGTNFYDIEFVYDGYEYDYDIDAITGDIIRVEKEKIRSSNTTPPATTTTTPQKQEGYIGAQKAEAIALKDAGLSREAVNRLETELKHEYGRMIYEVEFIHGGFEYEYDIDAMSGKIAKVEKDPKKTGGSSNTTPSPGGQRIGQAKAEEIALTHAGFLRGDVRKLETEFKEHKNSYEVEFKVDGWEYEYKIDSVTGKILEWEKGRD